MKLEHSIEREKALLFQEIQRFDGRLYEMLYTLSLAFPEPVSQSSLMATLTFRKTQSFNSMLRNASAFIELERSFTEQGEPQYCVSGKELKRSILWRWIHSIH